MPKTKKPMFHITLTSVGDNDFSAGYGRMEDPNAEVLLRNVFSIIAENLVGKKHHLSLVYDVCLDILKRLLKPEVDVNVEIKKFNDKENVEGWTLKDAPKTEEK